MASHVAVCCKLPHGLVLQHPMDKEIQVTLNGKNKSKIVGGEYGITPVDADFWAQWVAVNSDFPAVKSGAIYALDDPTHAEAVAEEFKDRKTGFEPLSPTAHGVKPAKED